MEVEEISLKDNPLLKRKELVLKVVAEAATPKKNELLDKVCSQYNVSDKKLVILDSIHSSFGKLDCEAIVKIYESEDALKSVEPQPKEKSESKPSNVPDESGQIKVDTGGAEEKKVEGGEVEGSETPKSGAPKAESAKAGKPENAKQEPKPEEKKE